MSNGTARRRAAILEILGRDGFTSILGLVQQLGYSQATIRRDLAQLDSLGRVRRTYGGALPTNQAEVPYREKLGEAADAKLKIARVAAALVEPGQAIGFTGGTTTLYVARQLPRNFGLTVATNALTIAMELATTDMRLILTGGELRGQTYELVGPLTEPVLQRIHLDVMFVGVDGVSVSGGLTTHNPVEAQANRCLIERSARVIVVADARKLGRRTFAQIVPLERLQMVITDAGADPAQIEMLRAAGVETLITD